MLDRSRVLSHIRRMYLTSPPPDALSHLGRLRRHRLRRRLKSEMVVDPICSLSLSRQRLFISFPTRSLAPPAATVYRYDEDNPLSLSLSLPFAFLAFARKRQNRVLNAGGTHARTHRGTEEAGKHHLPILPCVQRGFQDFLYFWKFLR